MKTTFWRMFVLLYLPGARGAGCEILISPRLAVIVLEFSPENKKVTLMSLFVAKRKALTVLRI